jgi:hypothetical protein
MTVEESLLPAVTQAAQTLGCRTADSAATDCISAGIAA